MKLNKIVGLGLVMALGLNLIGCKSTTDNPTEMELNQSEEVFNKNSLARLSITLNEDMTADCRLRLHYKNDIENGTYSKAEIKEMIKFVPVKTIDQAISVNLN